MANEREISFLGGWYLALSKMANTKYTKPKKVDSLQQKCTLCPSTCVTECFFSSIVKERTGMEFDPRPNAILHFCSKCTQDLSAIHQFYKKCHSQSPKKIQHEDQTCEIIDLVVGPALTAEFEEDDDCCIVPTTIQESTRQSPDSTEPDGFISESTATIDRTLINVKETPVDAQMADKKGCAQLSDKEQSFTKKSQRTYRGPKTPSNADSSILVKLLNESPTSTSDPQKNDKNGFNREKRLSGSASSENKNALYPEIQIEIIEPVDFDTQFPAYTIQIKQPLRVEESIQSRNQVLTSKTPKNQKPRLNMPGHVPSGTETSSTNNQMISANAFLNLPRIDQINSMAMQNSVRTNNQINPGNGLRVPHVEQRISLNSEWAGQNSVSSINQMVSSNAPPSQNIPHINQRNSLNSEWATQNSVGGINQMISPIAPWSQNQPHIDKRNSFNEQVATQNLIYGINQMISPNAPQNKNIPPGSQRYSLNSEWATQNSVGGINQMISPIAPRSQNKPHIDKRNSFNEQVATQNSVYGINQIISPNVLRTQNMPQGDQRYSLNSECTGQNSVSGINQMNSVGGIHQMISPNAPRTQNMLHGDQRYNLNSAQWTAQNSVGGMNQMINLNAPQSQNMPHARQGYSLNSVSGMNQVNSAGGMNQMINLNAPQSQNMSHTRQGYSLNSVSGMNQVNSAGGMNQTISTNAQWSQNKPHGDQRKSFNEQWAVPNSVGGINQVISPNVPWSQNMSHADQRDSLNEQLATQNSFGSLNPLISPFGRPNQNVPQGYQRNSFNQQWAAQNSDQGYNNVDSAINQPASVANSPQLRVAKRPLADAIPSHAEHVTKRTGAGTFY